MYNFPHVVPSGINIIPDISGSNSIGSASLPFANMYAANVIMSGGSAIVSGISSGIGFDVFNGKDGSNLVFNTMAGVGTVSITSNNGVIEVSGVPASSYADPDSTTDRGIVTWSGTGTAGFYGMTLLVDANNNLTPSTSGTTLVGTAALPFSGIYANNFNGATVVKSVLGEIPIGACNGTNKTYYTSQNIYSSGATVFSNGARMMAGSSNDFWISGTNAIQFLTAPVSGTLLVVDYVYL